MAFHIDKLEKRWIYITALMVAVAWGVQIYYAAIGWNPPSNVEVIDSAQLHLKSGVGGDEFSEKNIGVSRDKDGLIVVRMVAARYGFYPQEITLPKGVPFKIRIVSFDVLHGIYVPFSNLNLMLVPGYVSQETTVLNKLGTFPMVCQDFCGTGHAYMFGNVKVVPADKFKL